MSFLRIILLGSYLAGLVGLVWGVALRLGLPLGNVAARGALVFSIACFLCALATQPVQAAFAKPKE